MEANVRVQLEQTVQATDWESGIVVDVIGVQLVQGIDLLLFWCLARPQ
jgi:hypothetical protein